MAGKAAGSFLGNKKKKGILLYSTKKGEGAVPLAERQPKLLEFLIITDGGKKASQGEVGTENSAVCDRKTAWFVGNLVFGERLAVA